MRIGHADDTWAPAEAEAQPVTRTGIIAESVAASPPADSDVLFGPLPPKLDNIFSTAVRLGRLWKTRLDERLAPIGLTHTRWVTLVVLSGSEDGLMQRDLAAYVGIEGPTLCRVLDGLQSLGLIERREAAHDRRGKTIRLTRLAEPLIDQIASIADTLRAEAVAGLNPAEVALTDQLLKAAIQQMPGSGPRVSSQPSPMPSPPPLGDGLAPPLRRAKRA